MDSESAAVGSRLRWVDADHKKYKTDLQQFTCESPPPTDTPHRHQRIMKDSWRYAVETGIHKLKPPRPADELLWLGYDDEGLAVVVWAWERDGPALVRIFALARALRCRKQGYGVEALDYALEQIAGRIDAAGLSEGIMEGLIHRENRESMELASSFQMFFEDEDEDHLRWWLPIVLNPY